VPVDSRIQAGRSVRHAFRLLMEEEQFDRVVAPTTAANGDGFSADDVASMLQNVPAEIAILRPPLDSPDSVRGSRDSAGMTASAWIEGSMSGAEPHAETAGTNPDRDHFEVALASRALDRGIPLLVGVCRGIQVLNVACGAHSTSTSPTGWATSGTVRYRDHGPSTRSGSSPARSRPGWRAPSG
jgi:Peptidase C26